MEALRIILILTLAGCVHLQKRQPAPRREAPRVASFHPLSLLDADGKAVPPAAVSGLQLLGASAGWEFQCTAEAPAGNGPGRLRLLRVEVKGDRELPLSAEELKLQAPPPEVPFSLKQGFRDGAGVWFSDPLSPSLFRYATDGRLTDRLVPRESGLAGAPAFPPHYGGAARFGALTGREGRLVAFLQEPLGIDAPWVRLLEWDPDLKRIEAEYFYPLEKKGNRVLAAVPYARGRFLVIEAGEEDAVLHRFDLGVATDLRKMPRPQEAVERIYRWNELVRLGYRPGTKAPVMELEGVLGEKRSVLDGIALVDYHTVALLASGESGPGILVLREEGTRFTGGAMIDTPVVTPKGPPTWNTAAGTR